MHAGVQDSGEAAIPAEKPIPRPMRTRRPPTWFDPEWQPYLAQQWRKSRRLNEEAKRRHDEAPKRRPARKSHCSDLPCRWRCHEVTVGSFRYLVRARPEPPSACGISPRGAGGEGKWRLRAGLQAAIDRVTGPDSQTEEPVWEEMELNGGALDEGRELRRDCFRRYQPTYGWRLSIQSSGHGRSLCAKVAAGPQIADGHAILTWRTRKRFDLLATVV